MPTAGLPVWTYDLDVYGLGDDGGGGLKVGGHAVGADVDPDDPAAREAPPAEVERLVAAARRRLPGLAWPDGDAHVRGADVCCYALTPTEAPIVDRIDERTVVCAGFSGHGFKFAPTVATAAADLVLGRQPEVDLTPFRSSSRRSRRARSGAGARRRARSRPAGARRPRPARAGRCPPAAARRRSSARGGDQCLRASATRQRRFISRLSTESEEAPTWWTITASGVIAGW